VIDLENNGHGRDPNNGGPGRGQIRKVFPGNNTAQGFYSFYEHIIGPDARRILIIKGGPGVGKSTFMRKTAEALLERGLDVELHFCSSDPGSLDAVVFPQIGVAMIDGTAPHVTDPRNPGAVDEILHLGDFWDESAMRAKRQKIQEVNREVGRLFERAYRFLRAARAVYDDIEAANMEGMNFGFANKIGDHLLRELFAGIHVSPLVGRQRHLFASANTPKGVVHYLPTIIGPMKHKYIIEGDPGTGKSTLLLKMATAALERGYFVEMYHCALNPAKVEHVVVPGMSLVLTKSIEPHVTRPGPKDRVVDMNECLNPATVSKHAELLHSDNALYQQLLQRAFDFLAMAKHAHDVLEGYYVPNMNFAGVEELWERTLQRILEYADEARASVVKTLE
jgi:hypothetical protein